MEQQNREGRISIVEELVADLRDESKPRLNLDLVLGLLLLTGLLCWALLMWWHDTDASQHYQQAQQAAVARNWDVALANYSAASGYMDSNARAADAAGQVKKRDTDYRTVVTYTEALGLLQGASSEQAVAAILAARSIQTIEPGYKDTGATITRAEDQLFTDALIGTIVMREQAQPPGLYYRGPGGWLYMQGSDKGSQAFDTVSSSFIAYDAPASYRAPATETAPPFTTTLATGLLQGKPGRHVILARLSDDHKEATFQSLSLPLKNDNTYVFGERGVWGLSRYGSPSGDTGIGGNGDYNASSFVYETYSGSPVTGTVPLMAPDITILDLGRNGSSMLVAARGQMVDNRLTNRIYTAGPDGGNPIAVFSTTGMLIGASLSPDEQYAIVVSAEQDGASSKRVTVKANLLDLRPSGQAQNKNAPVIVAQTHITKSLTSSDMAANLRNDFHLSGVFLDDGAFKNKLLLGWVEGNSIRLRLIDPLNAKVSLAETSVGYLDTPYYRAPVNIVATVQRDGHTLLVYNLAQPLTQASSAQGEPFSTLVKVFRAQSQKGNVAISDYEISLPPEYVPNDKVPYLSDVVFNKAVSVFEITTGLDHTVYSLPINGTYMPTSHPLLRAITSSLYSAQAPGSPINWLKGPQALAYIDNTDVLHVRPYNAETEITLENGVSSMASIHSRNSYSAVLR